MNNRICHQGELIFSQGEVSNKMYEILSGEVGIFANYQASDEKRLATFGEGQTFGEMGVIEAYPRSASAVALKDGTEIREISIDEFREYFTDKPVLLFLLLKQLSQRLRETNHMYVEACRTVSETVKTQQSGEERPEGLRKKLLFFKDVYRSFLETSQRQ